MDILEAKRATMIIDKCKELIILLNGGFGTQHINSIIEFNKTKINKYNNDNRSILDATKTEIGMFKSFVKKSKYVRYNFSSEMIENTKFSQDIIDMYILSNRNYPYNYAKSCPLRNELINSLRNEVARQIKEQNYLI